MNTDNTTQSAPLAPPHYDLLRHPLVHYPESPSYTGCLDNLSHAANLLDLFGHITADDDSESGGLSAGAAEAYFWLTHMLKNTLRYVSLTLEDLQANQDQHHEQLKQLKQSLFLHALQPSDETDKVRINRAVAACLSISCTDVDAFLHLLDGGDHKASETPEEEA